MRNSTIGVNLNQKPTAIEKELKEIDKIKERQKVELQALLQHNLANYLKQKENEEKSKILSQRYSVDRRPFYKTINTSNLIINKR
jgi:biotin-(acetyl-CoA carboxylase) ligase